MNKKYFKTTVIFFLITILLFGISGSVLSAEKDKYGGIVKIATGKSSTTFGDPVEMVGPDREFSGPALQKLLYPTTTPGVYEPCLATSWELSTDGSCYIIHLQKGVKFHDGTMFNAQAAKWNLDRVVAFGKSARGKGGPPPDAKAGPGGPPPGGKGDKGSPPPGGKGGPPGGGEVALSQVASIDIIDEYTIRLNLTEYSNMVLFDLAVPGSCLMISPSAFDKNGADWAATHPVGTGPFKFKDYRRKAYVKYERFNDYWEQGLPYLDGVEIHTIPDTMTQLAALKAGEIQGMSAVDVQAAAEVEGDKRFRLVRPGMGQYIYIDGDSKDPGSFWSNQKMREAVEYAIDKEKLTKTVGRGYLIPIYQVLGGCPGDPATVPRKYDPEKARKLLAEAGYPNGFKCDLVYGLSDFKDLYVALQNYLSKIGIELNLKPLTVPAMMELRIKGVPPNELRVSGFPGGMTLLGPTMEMYTATDFNPHILRPEGSKELVSQILREKDSNKITSMFVELEEKAYGMAMMVPLWFNAAMRLYAGNLYDTIDGPDTRMQRAYFKK